MVQSPRFWVAIWKLPTVSHSALANLSPFLDKNPFPWEDSVEVLPNN